MLYFFVLLSFVALASEGIYMEHGPIVEHFKDKIHDGAKLGFKPRMMKRERKGSPHARPDVQLPGGVKSNVDLRFRDTPTKRQFGSTCSAFGLIAAMENALNKDGDFIEDLSEKHLWNKYRRYSSERAISAALFKGPITAEAFWPMNEMFPNRGYKANARARLLEAPFIDSDVARAIAALDQGRPVYLGLAVTDSLYACHKVVDPKSPINGGGHAVSIVGYGLDESIPGGGYFIIKNSWSPDCGDHGYQYMPFNYCTRQDMYCIMWDIKRVSQ